MFFRQIQGIPYKVQGVSDPLLPVSVFVLWSWWW